MFLTLYKFTIFIVTVWLFTGIIEGAHLGVTALQEHGKHIIYVTNNATRSEEAFLSKFEESNISAKFVIIEKKIYLTYFLAFIYYLRNSEGRRFASGHFGR